MRDVVLAFGSRFVGVLGLLAVGCIRVEGFNCERDADCDLDERQGWCENAGVCSYPASDCDSGRRYTENGGALANECVPLPSGSSDASAAATMETDTATPEVCDGEDNDGDGLVDEFAPGNTSCEGCTLFATDGRSWAACAAETRWADALVACEARGMSLASVHSAAEQAGIDAVAPFPDAFWIGLNDRDTEAAFVWADGSAVDYTAWAEGQPLDADNTEDCVASRATQGWSDRGCDLPLGYICAG